MVFNEFVRRGFEYQVDKDINDFIGGYNLDDFLFLFCSTEVENLNHLRFF